jgi:hypothetical protein
MPQMTATASDKDFCFETQLTTSKDVRIYKPALSGKN